MNRAREQAITVRYGALPIELPQPFGLGVGLEPTTSGFQGEVTVIYATHFIRY